MARNKTTGLILFGLGFCFLLGLAAGITFDGPSRISYVAAADRDMTQGSAGDDSSRIDLQVHPAIRQAQSGNWSLSAVAKAVAPAVVNISSVRIIQERSRRGPFSSDPFFNFFNRRGSAFPRERRERSLGSGVIVSPEGYVLTNNHVVEDAAEVMVYLADGREFRAEIVGTDPETDLAVLRIAGSGFPTIPFGDSDAADIGDLVLALGNPFGIGQTVTMGIISAKGRANVGIVEYEDFIQTDAAINPGNSGGALVDINGKLIGINTAIFSRSGGYQGIGFAIPAKMAHTVMASIVEHGKFVRGWAGIGFQNLSPEIARAFNAEGQQGALVNNVLENSPGEVAGLQRGDVVVSFDGRPVTDAVRLTHEVALSPSGEEVVVEYLRNGQRYRTKMKIAEAPTEYTYISKNSNEWVSQIEGVVVENLTSQAARDLGLRRGTKGVLVKAILPRSPAAYSGLSKNDVILEIDNQPVQEVEHFKSIMRKGEGRKMVLLIVRRGSLYYLSL